MAQSLLGFIKGILIQNAVDRTKAVSVEISNAATTATQTTISAAQTANRTVTLPNATTTLIGTSDSAVVTNKTIDADANTITNIEDADIKSGAAIAYSKLALTDSIVDADIDSAAAIAYSKLSLTDSIVDADIDSAAAINANKIGGGTVTNTKFDYISDLTNYAQLQFTALYAADDLLGSGKQNIDSDLTAIAGLSTNGLIARTSSGNMSTRTVTAGSSKLTVSNGDGVSGNPTVDVAEANLTISNMIGTLAIGHGGTGQATATTAFDALAPSSLNGDMIVRGSSNNIRIPVGTDGFIWTADSSVANGGVKWAAVTAPAMTYTAKTSTYGAAINDFVHCTSGTFTVTLPTAVGNSGKTIVVTNTGSGVITIATTSAQTVSGFASADVAIKLGTKFDRITVVSDGTNWQFLEYDVRHAVHYYLNSAQNFNARLQFNTVVNDPLALVTTGASWVFTAPMDGWYSVQANYQGASAVTMGLYKNGSLLANISDVVSNTHVQGGGTFYLADGDALHLLGGGSSTATTGVNTTYISIARVSS